ncbi:MAG: hypothetical protein KJO13_07850 [Gammaproteobacteria bacterium]|nr:hypothetical protein [Gammaproteobacteria bacterium]
MQFFLIILVLVLAGVGAPFVLEQSDLLLAMTFVVVIVGFIFGVSRIAKEE